MDLSVIFWIFLLIGDFGAYRNRYPYQKYPGSYQQIIDNRQNNLTLTPICETEIEELIRS